MITVSFEVWWVVVVLVSLYLLGGLALAVAIYRDPTTERAQLRVTDWFICVVAGVLLVLEWAIEERSRARTGK